MKRKCAISLAALLFVSVLLLSGCGARPAPENGDGGNETPAASNGEPANTEPQQPESKGTVNPMTAPGEVRAFLANNGIPHGDVYLQDQKVYINIVGLNDEIERKLASYYAADTYETVNVEYALEELEAAQNTLVERDLFRKLNLYESGIDVIANKVSITMPDSSEEKAKPEIEKWIEPGMIDYHIVELPPTPDTVGKIVELDATNKRILILEDGAEEPSIYFSFTEHTELLGAAGEPIAYKDLKMNMKVRVWTAGAVAMSMPAQATARRLEIAAAASTETQ